MNNEYELTILFPCLASTQKIFFSLEQKTGNFCCEEKQVNIYFDICTVRDKSFRTLFYKKIHNLRFQILNENFCIYRA